MSVKIATWNLCLGLPNKKDTVLRVLESEKIDICCLQETEIDENYPTNILSSPSYELELEKNIGKKRVGIYVNKHLKYTRREDLEEPNTHVIIIDFEFNCKVRVISLYRSFRPPNGLSPSALFEKQLDIVERNCISNTFVLGDFNLDFKMQLRNDYPHKLLFAKLTSVIEKLNLIQLVDFPTWSRSVNNTFKHSILDHVYTNNFALVNFCNSVTPTFGDHLLIILDLTLVRPTVQNIIRRNWSNYSKERLLNTLKYIDLNIDCINVQQYWNCFENLLINVIDEIIPIVETIPQNFKNTKLPNSIRTKINQRHRLIKKNKISPSVLLKTKIKSLDKIIKNFFLTSKCNKIRKNIVPGDNKSLWSAVKMAKNAPNDSIPKNLYLNNIIIDGNLQANAFANFFLEKVESIKNSLTISNGVYNGKNKLIVDNRFFMNQDDVKECILSLKPKKCEGFDRIPVCILVDAVELLLPPLTTLFRLIYDQKTIPDQWKMAKIIPVFKKGNKSHIENYRPIANQCSASKIYEKLILKQIHYLETVNKLDFTCKQQHGFKKNKSTATAGLLLHSLITHATDSNNYVLMASLDLSAAFDLVNVELLTKRLRIIGLPMDLVKLIEIWLTDRKFYVELNGQVSGVLDSNDGTIQGSVLGPILYAIFVSPLFDLANLTNFADDNFILEFNSKINELIPNMERKLEMITKWLKDSGLKVNETKTEICLFHRNDTQTITLTLQDAVIKSKKSMNVLGVTFDSKLNWSIQTANAINKANKSLFAIKAISKFFKKEEIKTLLTSNFYSTLYYNSEIWLSNLLDPNSKQMLLSASAKALRLTIPFSNRFISFEEIHKQCKQSTPKHLAQYKNALQLFKLFNTNLHSRDWVDLTNQIITGTRQEFFNCVRVNNYKIGLGSMVNKFHSLNGKIKLTTLNDSYPTFKYKCKNIFKPYEV